MNEATSVYLVIREETDLKSLQITFRKNANIQNVTNRPMLRPNDVAIFCWFSFEIESDLVLHLLLVQHYFNFE